MNTLSSFVGTWIALALFCGVAVLVCIGLVAKMGISSMDSETVSKGSVLSIKLSGPIEERETPLDLNYLNLLQGDIEKPMTLTSLTSAIGEAKENKNISAIYLKCEGVSASMATLHALREALIDFKKSEKKIIAYGGNLMMGDYYLASVADSLYLNPAGNLLMQGLGGTNLYLKGLFDKLGISFQVVKVGTFKSAVEPYILNEMSEPARAQLDTLYGNMWHTICTEISDSRKDLTPEKINEAISRDFIFIQPAEKVMERGFVDHVVYERSMDSIIAKMLSKKKDDLKFVSPSALTGQTPWASAYSSKKQVAVLYACGEIVDGGGAGTINYEKLVPQIVKLAEDDKVKAMVLRVNSPGGAVFGSDQIGEALDYFQKKGKPLAVAMGDYAASGGYWISCGADRIFADPLTITGSIGIFGLIPNGAGLAEKLGVSPQLVSTNPQADFPSLFYPMNQVQLDSMQSFIERGYDRFIARVAKGRKMPESKVRAIAEGRVWDAEKALKIGLVDQLGSVKDAADWVAKKAGIANSYEMAAYPSIEDNIMSYLPELGALRLQMVLQKALMGDYDEIMAKFAASVLMQKPAQARMPYINVGFQRVSPLN
nr:signal peptide peptidase SppA [uncultured Muribaculaceae bacterium]